jgi:hypothetical protein
MDRRRLKHLGRLARIFWAPDWRVLIESGLDFLSCSFDGYEKDMYEKNRVGAKFEWALDHLKGFLRLKRDLNAKHPLTVLQVMEIGAPPKGELERLRRAFLENFNGLPLDRVVLPSSLRPGAPSEALPRSRTCVSASQSP